MIPAEISPDPDPLLESNCLPGYPVLGRGIKFPPRYHFEDAGGFKYGWRCAYTKPWIKTLKSPQERDVTTRLFDAHGAGSQDAAGTWRGCYWLSSQLKSEDKGLGIKTPAFGYQGGQYLGLDESACWLWMYHPVTVTESPAMYRPKDIVLTGIDLVSLSGEPIPDSIPDGICWLYRLKNGKVAEVVYAADIECE